MSTGNMTPAEMRAWSALMAEFRDLKSRGLHIEAATVAEAADQIEFNADQRVLGPSLQAQIDSHKAQLADIWKHIKTDHTRRQ